MPHPRCPRTLGSGDDANEHRGYATGTRRRYRRARETAKWRLWTECRRVTGGLVLRLEADDEHRRVQVVEGPLLAAQLRQVLAAGHSTQPA